ncbi:MAG: hypothetical protein HY319_24810 [Armatimonadetes bacterium]|nr:hypothetical protein [Armatimonadota bacterium]
MEDRSRQILEKLQPALAREGLEVELVGIDADILNIRGRRVAPGVPTAFLVKAIAGTFRRYLPAIRDVCLVEYDPGPDEKKTRSSPDFEKVLLRKHAPLAIQPRGVPGLDLSGMDRARAIRAIEAFVKMWTDREVDRLKIVGIDEDAPGRAFQKWAAHYAGDYSSHHPEQDRVRVAIVHLREPCQDPACSAGLEEEIMPGRILVIDAGP